MSIVATCFMNTFQLTSEQTIKKMLFERMLRHPIMFTLFRKPMIAYLKTGPCFTSDCFAALSIRDMLKCYKVTRFHPSIHEIFSPIRIITNLLPWATWHETNRNERNVYCPPKYVIRVWYYIDKYILTTTGQSLLESVALLAPWYIVLFPLLSVYV